MSGSTTLYIVRHGQTEWNVLHKMQGHQDSPLTALGIRQAEWLRDSLKERRLDQIYTSSSERTRRTAEVIRGSRETEIIACPDLREIHLGRWEGRTQSEVKAVDPAAFEAFWNDPERFQVEGSETFREVSNRALARMNQILKQHQGSHILMVTHTVVVKLLMAHLEKRPLHKLWEPPYIHPACLCKVVITEGQTEILLHGDIGHYREAPAED